MRPLSLHPSALNYAEYTLFKGDLASLTDEDTDDPEALQLTIRETRGWMRGRYPGIPATTIARILALFPSKDTIHGGEFFAALRLMLHVEAGKDVDRALAFVQVHPNSATIVSTSPVSASAAPQPATNDAADQTLNDACRDTPLSPSTHPDHKSAPPSASASSRASSASWIASASVSTSSTSSPLLRASTSHKHHHKKTRQRQLTSYNVFKVQHNWS
ncbi:hypothetical protein C8R46DRAFT_1342257 [Mycena filopes]|nr:hypothetical protein C8R46DRAFT_1342257 [Mycena filopes]